MKCVSEGWGRYGVCTRGCREGVECVPEGVGEGVERVSGDVGRVWSVYQRVWGRVWSVYQRVCGGCGACIRTKSHDLGQ